MKKTFPHLSALFILFSFPGTLHAGADCLTLLNERCQECHYLTRVCQKVETEQSGNSWFSSPAGTWKRTVKNMVRQGAKLTGDEEEILVDCLSKPAPEIEKFCKIE